MNSFEEFRDKWLKETANIRIKYDLIDISVGILTLRLIMAK